MKLLLTVLFSAALPLHCLAPAARAVDVPVDTTLRIVFNPAPRTMSDSAGAVRIFRVADGALVDELRHGEDVDRKGPAHQGYQRVVRYSPIVVRGALAMIRPHNSRLDYGTEYRVVVDAGMFEGANLAPWTFRTRAAPPSGVSLTVDDEGPADFRTVQGVLDHAIQTLPRAAPVTIRVATSRYDQLLYLKNFVFAYNFVSTGDDDIALKGGNNPSPAGSGLLAINGKCDVRSDRKYSIVIAHNHIYWGHGISIGSETNGGVTNVEVYDNSFTESEEGLRIKSDYARGGEVSNINYRNICIRNADNALLFTPYYSTRAGPAAGPLVPNFHDITLNNVVIQGASAVKLQGFQANSGGYNLPAYPLGVTMVNVVADQPTGIKVISSDANLTISGVNLPVLSDAANRVVVNGVATLAVDPAKVLDCSKAYVDFPAIGQSNLFGSRWTP